MSLALVSTCVGGRRAGLDVQIYRPVVDAPKQRASRLAASNQAGRLWGLTDRDCQILDAYIKHGLLKIVAAELGLQCHSIETALRRMHAKAGVNSSIQLVAAYVTAKSGGFE